MQIGVDQPRSAPRWLAGISGAGHGADHSRRDPSLASGAAPNRPLMFLWSMPSRPVPFTLSWCDRQLDRSAERGRELFPRSHRQLSVDTPEVRLDSLDRDEQRLGNLLVAEVGGSHLRDPSLACGQRVEPAQHHGSRMRAGGGELVVCAYDERRRAATMCLIDTVTEQLPGFAAAVAPPQRRAKVDERTRMLEPCGRRCERL